MKRVEIDEKSNIAILTFNKRFYPEELVKQAILDFKDACDARFQSEKLILKPKGSEINAGILGYEFYNYLLAMLKS